MKQLSLFENMYTVTDEEAHQGFDYSGMTNQQLNEKLALKRKLHHTWLIEHGFSSPYHDLKTKRTGKSKN